MLHYWTKVPLQLKHWDFALGISYMTDTPRNFIINIHATSLNSRQNKRKRFILSDKLHPQTISCVQTRAGPFGVKIEVENVFETDFTKKDISGVIFQYPDTEGSVHNFTRVVQVCAV